MAEARTDSHLPLRVPQEAGSNESDNHIEQYVAEEDTKVSPPVVEADVEAAQEVVADAVGAVPAVRGRIRVVDVTADSLDERASPLLARLSCRWAESRELLRLAVDEQVVQLGRHQT